MRGTDNVPAQPDKAQQVLLDVFKKMGGSARVQEVSLDPRYKKFNRSPQGLGRDLRVLKQNGLLRQAGHKRYEVIGNADLQDSEPKATSIPLDAIPDRPPRKKYQRHNAATPKNGLDNTALAKDLVVAAHKLLTTAVQLLGG